MLHLSSSGNSALRSSLLLQHRPLRTPLLVVHAASKKGFGSAKPKKDAGSSGTKKGGSGRQRGVAVQPPQQQQPGGRPQVPAGLENSLQQFDDLEAAKRQAEQEAEFQARLELIKAEAAQKRAAATAASSSASSPSASGSATPRAVFDAPPEPEDIYANPPSLLSTLQDKLQPDIQDPALRQAQIGPGQLGLAGGALLFGLVFLLVSGGDFATTNRYKGVSTRAPPDPIEMSRLEQQAEGFEELLKQNPDDLQALEAAAVTYARMQDYSKAASYLDRLTAAKPGDIEALRLLGESRLLNAEPAKSVAAYETAIALAPNDQSLITGLVDSYVANSQQAKAVDYLNGLRDKLLAAAAAASGSSSTSTSGSSENSAATAAVLPSSSSGEDGGDAAATSSSGGGEDEASTSDRVPVDPVGVQLLLGKAYAAWRGHDTDALAAYDTLIRAFPEDFRGYLAKGMFLRDRGRQGDAERMFLQAKFYAPDSMQKFVSARSGERAVVDLPDNGME